MRKFRGILFVALGASGATILIKLGYFYEPQYMMDVITTPWALGGIIYTIGATIYVARVPERCKPGRFNIFGSSH